MDHKEKVAPNLQTSLKSRSKYISLLMMISLSLQPIHAAEISVSQKGAVRSLKSALKLAADGDTIRVKTGHYLEHDLLVDKKICLIGQDFPMIDAGNRSGVMRITADGVSVSGFVITQAGLSYIKDNAGIKLDGVKNCRLEGNRFLNNFFAVYLAKSENCRVAGNTIKSIAERETSAGNGIHLWYCKNIEIDSNAISGHRDGIYLEFVEGSRIRSNLSQNNLRYGLHFMFSNDCHYEKNTFRANGAGVAVMYSKRVLMEANRFENNWGPASYGILLKDISDSRIIKNQFLKNSTGLYTEAANRLQIEQNIFDGNGWAVKIMANSMDNTFCKNDFLTNSFDVATNSRQNFNTFSGNYWQKYKGYDLNHDGTGDIPFCPVKLFSLIVEKQHPALILMKSFFVDLLEVAEAVLPVLTPETLIDQTPRMERVL
jgi:nitrous oxidase accessory protein